MTLAPRPGEQRGGKEPTDHRTDLAAGSYENNITPLI
jgi:hypothetical protein